MKPKLLSILVCPDCKEGLDLETGTEVEGEILEGALSCRSCRSRFPIRKGVPRFVQMDEYVDTFSFEWNRFHDVQIDILNATDQSEITFRGKTGWSQADLAGKRVLDVGIGAGRFADVISRWGGEVVGVDLSFAVDAAYGNVGKRENVHIVQADLFRLPFPEGTFDVMYSLGVLHHTPDTKKAFDAVVPYLRPGGEFAVFLYAEGPYAYFSDIWRKFTTKVPHRLVYYFSALSIPCYYLRKLPLVGLGLRILLPMNQHPNPRWRWLDTFDWYSPKYQHKHTWPEVYGWYEENGFTDMKLLVEPGESPLGNINMRGCRNPDSAR